MKKIVKYLTLAVITLVMCLSLTACTFIDLMEGNKPTVPDGEIITQTVVLPVRDDTEGTERKLLNKIEANKAVERTVVEIQLDANGAISAGAGVLVDIKTDNSENENVVYVITCNHVIDSEGGKVRVIIPDLNGDYLDADYVFDGVIGGDKAGYTEAVQLVGGDKDSDIAVLRIDLDKKAYSGNKLARSKVQTAILPPNSYNIEQGEDIIAIGNPTGALPGWLTHGIISMVETINNVNSIGEMKLIGINAQTNHGNSGGGLFNMYGELIGITNAGSDDYQAINFAIPLYTSDKGVDGVIDNGVVNIVSKLIASETSSNYGYVEGRREKFGFTITNNAGAPTIYSVLEGSQAKTSGLKTNDVVVGYSVNGGIVKTNFDYDGLMSVLDGLKIGDTISFTVSRNVANGPGGVSQTSATCTLTAYQYRFCDTGK